MNNMIAQGYDDTKNIINNSGAQGNAKAFYEESSALLNGEIGGAQRNPQNHTHENLKSSYNKLKESLKHWLIY